jgi:hypothetical protein
LFRVSPSRLTKYTSKREIYLMTINLTDDQKGTHAKDGGIETWPKVDIFNRPYEQYNATTLRIPGGFIVVPPDGMRRLDEADLKALTQPAADVVKPIVAPSEPPIEDVAVG